MSAAPDHSHLDGAASGHVPVMGNAVLAALGVEDGEHYVDATFGRGGYTREILDAAATRVWAIDRDPSAIAVGQELAACYPGRLTMIHGRFGDLDRLLAENGAPQVKGIAFDLGVSSPQLDEAERGFSFRQDGPLDMRMGSDGPSAEDLVNDLPESELIQILRDYGEERKARRIAKRIVQERSKSRITRTSTLAEIVYQAIGRGKPQDIDPATRTFQGIRIAVNDELGELTRALHAAERALAPGGRLVVVAFHSLEDRVVKRFLRERSGDVPRASRHAPLPEANQGPAPTFTVLHRNARKPTDAEASANPRARSARLRAGERTAAPAWPATSERATSGREGGFA